MATPKKNPLITIATIAGSVLTIGAAITYGITILDKKIDERVECKLRYLVILVKEIATDEQKQKADKEFARWNNK